MLQPPPQGDPYELVDPTMPHYHTEAVRLGLLNWQTFCLTALPSALEDFAFFTDPTVG
jgi:hypothetical protein